MPPHVFWWVLAFVLVALELTTGTFYLLLYGTAAGAAGLVGWFELGMEWQLLTAAAIAVAGTLGLRRFRNRSGAVAPGLQDLDIGQTVVVERWDGSAGLVRYRGTEWDAEFEHDGVDTQRPLYIRAMRGSVLILGN